MWFLVDHGYDGVLMMVFSRRALALEVVSIVLQSRVENLWSDLAGSVLRSDLADMVENIKRESEEGAVITSRGPASISLADSAGAGPLPMANGKKTIFFLTQS